MTVRNKRKYARSSLNDGQIKLLEIVYKYRFGSRQLIAESLNIKPGNGLYERLEVLVNNGYLGKRFDKRLKLLAIPAAYYLAPKGLRTLSAAPGHDYITEAVIKNSYKDKTVGQAFITHTLDTYKYTNLLKHHYPSLKVFTRRDMAQYEYFPSMLPDAFLSLPTEDAKQPKRFFLDVVPANLPRIAIDRRISAYGEFFDNGGWDITESDIPAVLLLCEDGTTEKRARRSAGAQLHRLSLDDEIPVYTSTVNALAHLKITVSIWTSIEDSEELMSLDNLS